MKGKLVNVYFQHADALFGVLVEHEPCGVGDSWALLDRDGRCHRALLFERIDECAPSEEESASNSGGVAGGRGTANTARDAIAFYTLNCDVCGRVITRRNAFDVRCDEHPWV